MCVYVCAYVVHELLDYEQESAGISSQRIILGEVILTLPWLLGSELSESLSRLYYLEGKKLVTQYMELHMSCFR